MRELIRSCTYHQTGTQFQKQLWAHCYDCFISETEGACVVCIQTCHRGHRIGLYRHSDFFCDCSGTKKCLHQNTSVGSYANPNPNPQFSSDMISGMRFMQPTDIASGMRPMRIIPRARETLAAKMFPLMNPGTVFSPLSIAFALKLLEAGAATTTKQQIADLVGTLDIYSTYATFNSDIVHLANALIVNTGFPISAAYKEAIAKVAMISNEDFSKVNTLVQTVNSYIAANTNNLIKNILSADMISPDSQFILVSTLYFKTTWLHPFPKHATQRKLFNNTKAVDMMHISETFGYYRDSHVQVLEMPYAGGEYCMGFILGDSADYIGVDLRMQRLEVEAYIPRFTQRHRFDPTTVLQKLGVTDLFNGNCDLTRITDPSVFVSEAVHEAVVIVDEAGTEASAVTMMVCDNFCMSDREEIVFNADHTFTYYIKHLPSGILLFIGEYDG